jgi:hypothetical protein
MPPTYILARDHLEQAVHILQGNDSHTVQLRAIVERTIGLMREYERSARISGNVVDFAEYFYRPRN